MTTEEVVNFALAPTPAPAQHSCAAAAEPTTPRDSCAAAAEPTTPRDSCAAAAEPTTPRITTKKEPGTPGAPSRPSPVELPPLPEAMRQALAELRPFQFSLFARQLDCTNKNHGR